MTASEALDRWSAAHDHLAKKEMAMHCARAMVRQGEFRIEQLEALQVEVDQLRRLSDAMLVTAMEMLRQERQGRHAWEGAASET